MDHTLTEVGLRLSYLRSKSDIDALDHERILDDLAEGSLAGETPVGTGQHHIPDHDHLVLATDVVTGATLGLLGAQDRTAGSGTFLWLETGFVVASARGQNLLRRMIALSLLRIAGMGTVPEAVVAVTRNPIGCHVLRSMAGTLRGSRFAPDPDEAVVRFDSGVLMRDIAAALGHRMHYGMTLETLQHGRSDAGNRLRRLSLDLHRETVFAPVHPAPEPLLGMLDLRAAHEDPLMEDLRALYRAKAARCPVHALPPVDLNPYLPGSRAAARPVGGIAAP